MVQGQFAAAQQALDRDDPIKAEDHVMNVLAQPSLTDDQEINCLRLAGNVAEMSGRLEDAVACYQACVGRAEHRPETAASAKQKLEELRSKLHPDVYRMAKRRGEEPHTVFIDGLLQDTAGRHLDNDDPQKAAHVYDIVIPRLLNKDAALAQDALENRLRVSRMLKDGQQARLHLALARAHIEIRNPLNAALCCQAALSDNDEAQARMRSILEPAAELLKGRSGLDDGAQWCMDAMRKLRHDAHDVATLGKHIAELMNAVLKDAEDSAAQDDFDPLLDYVEAHVNAQDKGAALKIFKQVLDRQTSDFDAKALEEALEERMADILVPEAAAVVAAQLQLALTDHQVGQKRLASAALSLQRVLETDLSCDPALLPECLNCSARLAAAAGQSHSAIFMLEAARLSEIGMESTSRPPVENNDRMRELAEQQEAELAPTEVEAARQDARKAYDAENPASVLAATRSLIDIVCHSEGLPEGGAASKRE